MPQKRITVKKSKEIIRLYHQGELGQRQIARAMNLSRPVVSRVVKRWTESGLSWEELQGVPDSEFQELLYPQKKPPGKADDYTVISRRIDDTNRIVYAVDDNRLTIISCRYHY